MKRHLATLLLALLPLAATAAPSLFRSAEPEILEPAEAYRVSVSADGDALDVRWQIAEGYYLYRDKLGFVSASDGVTLGEAALPMPTEIKDDEFFGKMAVYRGDVAIRVPFSGRPAGAATLALDLKAQGCADIGICYPPETRRVDVALPVAATGAAGGGSSALARLGQSLGFGDSEPEFLEPEQAFAFSAEAAPAGDAAIVRWQIADGYYLYRDKFRFSTATAGVRVDSAELPPGKPKDDPYFGRLEIYTGAGSARVPLAREDAGAGPFTLTVGYQGCADGGICYPPLTRDLALDLPPLRAAQAGPAAPAASASPPPPAVSLSEQDDIAASLARGASLLTILTFFGFGLLLAFTPCVFPMIPILSGIIVGHGTKVTTGRAFVLSLVYVLAMALTYTVAGVLAGLFGSNLQATFQNPWILGSFAALFVLLSLSMFGLYDLQVPNWAQSRISSASNRQASGSLTGVAVMGFLSALIVGPCVAAPLAGALIYIGQTGDAVLGGAALFALSLGMGAPLLVIGTSAGKLLPKAGAWMNPIKAVFGVLLLGVAIWMLERILPAPLTMALWAALLIVSAIYLGALDHLSAGASGWRRLWKGAGLVMLLWGAVLLVGAAGGGRDVFQPLRGAGLVQAGGEGGVVHAAELAFRPVKSVADLEREVALASGQGRGVMLDFYADWCVTCKEMERETFSDAAVQGALADTVLLQADVTANDDVDQALLKRFGLIGPPTIMFFGRDGGERRDYRVMGFMGPADFTRQIQAALR